MKWLRYIVLLLTAYILIGCSMTKHAVKQKETTEETTDKVTQTQTLTERYREGGEIKTTILPEAQRERDENGQIKELIQTLKEGGLTKTIIYKPDGSVDVDCTADAIFEKVLQKQQEYEQNQIQTTKKDKDTQKETKLPPINILFIFIGLVLLIVIYKKL